MYYRITTFVWKHTIEDLLKNMVKIVDDVPKSKQIVSMIGIVHFEEKNLNNAARVKEGPCQKTVCQLSMTRLN